MTYITQHATDIIKAVCRTDFEHLTNRHVHAVIVFLLVHLYCSLHYKNKALNTFPVGPQCFIALVK